jgi:DNA-binding transcriptional LysR family regulator
MALLQHGAQLRHFLAVAAEGSVSAAAHKLAISQPALTRSIRRLEAELGVALFERLPRGVSLTSFGQVLFRHAQRIATEIQFAEAELDAFRQGGGGRLRVGAGPFWGASIVPTAIARLQARFPRLTVHLEVGVNALVLPRLYAGELDVIFGAAPDPATVPPYVMRREFLLNEIRVVAGEAHPLLERTRVALRDLEPYPWAVYQQDTDVLAHLMAALQRAGAAPPAVRVEVTSMSALLQLLKSGPYLACVSEALINAAPEAGIRILPVAAEIWRFQTCMLAHRSLEGYAPVAALADLVLVQVKQLRRPGAPAGRAPAGLNAISERFRTAPKT